MVIKCATKWKELGRHLDIHEHILNITEKDNPHSCESCCSKMLSDWLDSTPNATWAVLLDAVDKTNDLPDIVEKLNAEDMVEKISSIANDLPAKVEKLDMVTDKLDATADKIDKEVDRLPDTVQKFDNAVDKLPGAVAQLCEVIDQLPKMVGKVQITEDIDLDGSAGNIHIHTYTYIHITVNMIY